MDSESLNTAMEIALWYKSLKETNNESFMELFFDESRYIVLKGGGGSGKSIFAGRKVLKHKAFPGLPVFLQCR